jgi:Leucine rich repeat
MTQLVLTHNPLQSLPAEIGQLTNLRTLVVRESFALAYLPPEMCSLKALQTLDLEYNNLQYLPREIGRLRKLATLSLSGNWLQELPRQMCQLPHLAHLNLSSNRITELPKEIDQLISLTSLRLDEPLLNALPARLQALIDTPRRPERKAIFFETGPYYDRSGHGQSPRRLVCHEINVDYSQFLLQDAHTHLECEQQGTVDNWIQISEHGIVFLSAAQYHYAWVRMEAWEDEPPAVPGSWEMRSELTIIPHSGIVMLAELMGGWSASLELLPGKEPGCPYRMRASCRGRETLAEFFTIQWEDDEEEDPIPHGLEQYLLQFWPL